MANENEIEVDLLTSDQGLGAELAKVTANLQRTLDLSLQFKSVFTDAVKVMTEAPKALLTMNMALSKLNEAGKTSEASALQAQIDSTKADLDRKTKEVASLRQQLASSSEARAIQQDQIGGVTVRGRTIDESKTRNQIVGAYTTAINTDDAQMVARIADAAGKAAERLVKTAEASLIARFNQVGVTEQIRQNTYGNVGYAQAQLTQANIAAERKLRDFGPNAPQTLAQADAVRADQEVARRQRADADYENAERNRLARTAAIRLQAQAEEENRQFNRNSKDVALRERQAAEDENALRTRIAKQVAIRERAAADYENAQRKQEERQAALRERSAADAENLARKTAERQNAIRERSQADFENKARSGDLSTSSFAKDAAFSKKFGIERSEFQARIAAENLSIEGQKVLLQGLADKVNNVNVAKRSAPKVELTDAEKIAQRNRASNESLDQRLSDNGGATFFALQSRIAANFAIFGAAVQGIRSAASAIIDFDEVMKQFQAITDTTNVEMVSFRGQLLGIASDSKFSVTEIGKVAISLGQTGLSASEVAKALKPVIDLATASGSTLQQSVEAVTSVLGAYSLEATRAGDVSDVFVGALNRTKLTMEQLQLGIQYAANIARDSGVSFSELTATVGTIAQAGVKSGSTIGTGVRQLLTELSSPTEKFRAVLKELGISLADVDLKTNGLTGVLENLRNKGFSTADALRSLDLRAAAAYSALSGQGDRLKTLQQELLLSSAAAEASTKANESLAAGFQRFQNSAFAVVDKALFPMVEALKQATGGAASLLQMFSTLGPILPVIGTGLASIAAAAAGVKVLSLVTGLLGGAIALPVLPIAGVIAATVAVGVLISKFDLLANTADTARQRLDQLKASQNELTGAISSVQTNTAGIDTTIQTLIERRDRLNSDGILRQTAVIEAQKAFGEIGLSISSNITNIDELVQALQRLRSDMSKRLPPLFDDQARNLREQIAQMRILQEEQAKVSRPREEQYSADPLSGNNVYTNTYVPLDKFNPLGSQFDRAKDLIQNPSILGKDANAAAGSSFASLLDAEIAAKRAKVQADLEGDRKEVANQEARLALLEELRGLLQRAVDTQNNKMSKEMALDRVEKDGQAANIQATDRFQSFLNAVQSGNEAKIRVQTGILGDNSLNDIQKREKLGASAQDFRAQGDLISTQLNEYLKELLDKGVPQDIIDRAATDLRNKISEFTKLVSDPVRQNYEAMASGAKDLYERQKRVQERTIENALKAAGTTQNAETVAVQEQIIKQAVEQIGKINLEVSRLSNVNPDNLELDAGARRLNAQLEDDLKLKADGFAMRIAEVRKSIAEKILDYRTTVDEAQRQKLIKEADKLTKILQDATTTPDKARELVAEINRLLSEATEIAKRQNSAELQKQLVRAPADALLPDAQGRAVPGPAARQGSVPGQIIDAANANGADAGMTRYLLALAQLESSQNPNSAAPGSSARGLLQFLTRPGRNGEPSTWDANGGGDVYSIQDQIRNGLRFTRDNDRYFQDRVGRAPTDEERFVLHNQGRAGGTSLIQNPSSLASSNVRDEAITGNRGNLNMTSEQFVEVLKNMFRNAMAGTQGQVSTVGRALNQAAADKDRAAEDELGKKKIENAKRVDEIERNSQLNAMKAEDRKLAVQLQGQEALVRRAKDAAEAQAANISAIDTLAEQRTRALTEDKLKPGNRTPDQIKESADEIVEKFRQLAETEAISAADVVGKLTLKVYDDQINQIQARLKELAKDNADGKATTAEENQLKQQLDALKETKELKGQIQALDAETKSLNDSANEIEQKGLGTRKDLLKITDQLAAVEAKRAALLPGLAAQQEIKERPASILTGIDQGVGDFERSRGIRDNLGNLTTAASQARKAITADLNVLANGFDTLFTDLATGSIKAGDALKKFAQTVLTGLLQQASRALTNSIFASIFGAASGSAGGGGGLFSGIQSLFSSAIPTSFGAANGELIPGMAGGGEVTGGVANRDSVLRRLMPGEMVLRRSAVQAVGKDNLLAINAMGGQIQSRSPQMSVAGLGGSSSRAEAKIYIVPPDAVPPPSAAQIVHHITNDIETGGQVARLIKSVTAGHNG